MGGLLLNSTIYGDFEGMHYNESTRTERGLGGVLGVVVGTARVHWGARVSLTTLEDSDAVWTLGAGIVF